MDRWMDGQMDRWTDVWMDAWSPSGPDPSLAASPTGSRHTRVFAVSREPLHCLTPQKSMSPTFGTLSLGPFRIANPNHPQKGCVQLPTQNSKEDGVDCTALLSSCSRTSKGQARLQPLPQQR